MLIEASVLGIFDRLPMGRCVEGRGICVEGQGSCVEGRGSCVELDGGKAG